MKSLGTIYNCDKKKTPSITKKNPLMHARKWVCNETVKKYNTINDVATRNEALITTDCT